MTGNLAMDQVQNVSRETQERFDLYLQLVRKWNPHINLVSRTSVTDIWKRHLLDLVQIYHVVLLKAGHWVDMGSGGGFPGIVIAIMAAEKDPDLTITLIDSDQRKSTFLRQALRELGLHAEVLSQRIEQVPCLNASVVTARALTSLNNLCAYADRHLADGGIALFPKGENWKKEVQDARSAWSFSLTEHRSMTDPDAVILELGDLRHG